MSDQNDKQEGNGLWHAAYVVIAVATVVSVAVFARPIDREIVANNGWAYFDAMLGGLLGKRARRVEHEHIPHLAAHDPVREPRKPVHQEVPHEVAQKTQDRIAALYRGGSCEDRRREDPSASCLPEHQPAPDQPHPARRRK